MRTAAKVDGNHAEIVRALRDAFCSVLDLSRVGKGCPDILVAFQGRMVLMEIKRPKAKGQTAGKLEKAQEEFRDSWRGPVVVVHSVEEALAEFGIRVAGRVT
jgi:hypothetical protein